MQITHARIHKIFGIPVSVVAGSSRFLSRLVKNCTLRRRVTSVAKAANEKTQLIAALRRCGTQNRTLG